MTNEHFFSTKHQDSSTIRFDYWLDRRYYWLHQYHLFIDRLLFFDINSLQEVLYNVILLNKKAFKEIFDWILKGCLDTKGAWALRAYINTKNVVFQDEKKAIYWIERLEMVTDIINEHFAAIGHKNPEEDFLSDRYFGMLGVHFRFGMCLIYAYAKSLNIPQLAEKKDYFATMIRRYYSLFEGSIKYILDDLDTPTREAFCALDLEIPSHAENLSEDKNSQ